MPYLTPLPTPAIDAGCRRLSVPEDYFPIVLGALLVLTDVTNWEQDGGQDTVQEAVDKMVSMLEEVEDCPSMIGQVVTLATTTVPSNMLECNGAGYLRVDYPELYAAIGSVWIVDADNFVVPDMRGRAQIGVGEGGGLTLRGLGDEGGEEEVTLVIDEMPEHDHPVTVRCVSDAANRSSPVGHLWARESHEVTNLYSTLLPDDTMRSDAVSAGDKGGGTEHDNMPPFVAFTSAIVATDG